MFDGILASTQGFNLKACRNPPWLCRDRDRSYVTEALACLVVFKLSF